MDACYSVLIIFHCDALVFFCKACSYLCSAVVEVWLKHDCKVDSRWHQSAKVQSSPTTRNTTLYARLEHLKSVWKTTTETRKALGEHRTSPSSSLVSVCVFQKYHQNLIIYFLASFPHFSRISKSLLNFLSYLGIRQIDRQADRQAEVKKADGKHSK